MRKTSLRALTAATMAVALATPASIAPASATPNNNTTKKLLDAVTVSGLMRHERALQSIANANGGTRASGTPGYDASAQYVLNQLVAASYSPVFQEFTFPFFEELAPAILQQVSPNPPPTRPRPSSTRGRATSPLRPPSWMCRSRRVRHPARRAAARSRTSWASRLEM